MTHSFDTEIAKKYGILEAVLLQNIHYWIAKNRESGKNLHDGKYWTYNSTKALQELFPYASERQIKYALKKLREEGVIKTGNYNRSAMDKTLWYTLTDSGEALFLQESSDRTNLSHREDKKELSKEQDCPADRTKTDNGEDNFVQAIPDRNTDKKPDRKPSVYSVWAQAQKEETERRTYSDKTTVEGYRNREKNRSRNRFCDFPQHTYTHGQMENLERILIMNSQRRILRC